jgi:hypothetical protein
MQAPDRQPMPGEWGYRPENGSTVAVNPPPLTWIHSREAASYDVQWATRRDMSDALTVEKHRWCVYTHHEPLKPGKYYWRYRIRTRNGAVSPWSQIREFTVTSRAVLFPTADAGSAKGAHRNYTPPALRASGGPPCPAGMVSA